MCGSDAMDFERGASELSPRPLVFLTPTLFDLVRARARVLTSEAGRALYTAWAKGRGLDRQPADRICQDTLSGASHSTQRRIKGPKK